MTDPLSDVLRAVRLRGGVFFEAHLTAPWCMQARLVAENCKPLLQRPMQLIGYHLVLEGRLQISVADQAPTEVSRGELVVMPRNDDHVAASGPGLRPSTDQNFIRVSPEGRLPVMTAGGGGTLTRIACGFLGSDDGFNPLIASLPPILKLDLSDLASRGLVEASMSFAISELMQGRFPSSDTMSRVSELLFVEAVRHYAESGRMNEGWLRGLKDPQIGKALALLHGDIAASWSVERLAKAVALSRSAFISRFTSLVGLPPMQYLVDHRLRIAKSLLLSDSSRNIAQIAPSVGYASEQAFSRAFKREFGLPPALWRAQAVV